VIEQVLLAQSTDRERNVAASSGGVIKELLREYLARDEVDGASPCSMCAAWTLSRG
jgi:coenzyme F420-reducing hydrogenase beta subunit